MRLGAAACAFHITEEWILSEGAERIQADGAIDCAAIKRHSGAIKGDAIRADGIFFWPTQGDGILFCISGE